MALAVWHTRQALGLGDESETRWAFIPPRNKMSVPTSAPKTIPQLQNTLRLKTQADAEALIKALPVENAFRMYMNRCLSAGSTKQELPDWKDVDEYLQEKRILKRVRLRGQTLEDVVAKEAFEKPYDLVRHASLFALRVKAFLKSDRGEKYDVILDKSQIRQAQDLAFDRIRRIMALLGFLVHQSRERQKELNRRRDEQMRKAGFV
ncbi:hypothetical protein F4821DRAFT_108356 [Hypoxylon rubiginosum]|uniref:Uncharacterized protein n=1 Tax=Hypoxylon rubiginosum TaxID=110542 RepID=A0ACC0D463_9PEZI|nr:hypothetical protein F4821DRAFT_108356 [Hypoxylon rubiginosum]